MNSYSLYRERLAPWFTENVAPDWNEKVAEMMTILQEESSLDEIVKLVGVDALSADDRLTLEVARSVREDFLQQDSFSEYDSYMNQKKMSATMDLILSFYHKAKKAIAEGADIEKIASLSVREQISRAKEAGDDRYTAVYAEVDHEIDRQLAELVKAAEEGN